jgi:predicted nucleic acid-binding protein
MKIETVLANVAKLHIETAPIIYFIEQNPIYVARMRHIFEYVQAGTLQGSSSVITLTEVLIHPFRLNNEALAKEYQHRLTQNKHFNLIPIYQEIAILAAQLRAQYNLKTPDALQIATAVHSNCDACLTNDGGWSRVKEIPILVLDDLDNP